MTYLPLDNDNHPIPALRLKAGGAHRISSAATAARNATAFSGHTRVVSLYATSPVYVKFGTDNTVTATSSDHYFPSGVYYDFSIGGGAVGHSTHVSVIRVSTDGDVYISEKE